jgi:hypothetical protein
MAWASPLVRYLGSPQRNYNIGETAGRADQRASAALQLADSAAQVAVTGTVGRVREETTRKVDRNGVKTEVPDEKEYGISLLFWAILRPGELWGALKGLFTGKPKELYWDRTPRREIGTPGPDPYKRISLPPM